MAVHVQVELQLVHWEAVSFRASETRFGVEFRNMARDSSRSGHGQAIVSFRPTPARID